MLKATTVLAEGWAGGGRLKVCIPTSGNGGLDDTVGEHFGRVPTYTIIDTETNEVKVIKNTTLHMGGEGYPPHLIRSVGAEVMICSGLGRRAIAMFEEMGVSVYVGAYGTVRDAINMWQKGKLQMATDENACRQHKFRDHRGGPV